MFTIPIRLSWKIRISKVKAGKILKRVIVKHAVVRTTTRKSVAV